MPSILELPEDLILEVIGHVNFTSLLPLMCTSKRVYELIKTHERSLCKSIYLAHLVRWLPTPFCLGISANSWTGPPPS